VKIIKDLPPSKIIIALLLCLLIGGLLPYLFASFSGKLVLFVGLMFLFLVVLFFKKGKITVYDWLILICVGIPLHDFRIMFGSFFLRTTEVFFIPFMIWGSVQIFKDEEKLRNLFRLPFDYVVLIFFCAFSLMSTVLSENVFISSYRTLILLTASKRAILNIDAAK